MPEYILILIRSISAFFVLLVMARLMGKKQVSHLTFFDYVVGITIGSIAATLSVDQNVTILNGLMGILVWGFFPIMLGLIDLKSYKLRRLIDGAPTVMIQNGKVLEGNLQKEKMTTNELMLLLREHKAFKLADVEFAVLETNGKLSVMKKSDSQPITPKSLGIQVEAEYDPRTVIIDGNVMERTLKNLGYTKEWLKGELLKKGASHFEDVFYGQIDSKGNVYIDLYDDKIEQIKIKTKPLLAATLKKVQADLEMFTLQTQDPQAKETYELQSKNLQQLIETLQPYLKE
jgi:uncharacterized membrane protein YcaP (DUF421 family)